MSKYLRLMNGTKFNAGGFEVEINKVVEASKWNPNTFDPVKMQEKFLMKLLVIKH